MITEVSTAELYRRVSHVIPEIEWATMEDDVEAINRLKREKNAVILAHNYMTPEIFHCVSDIVGDSLALARRAQEVDADIVLVAGVHFMAETAKLLNPERTVLVPDLRAGCSLAESIAPADIAAMRKAHPGVPIVTYVNTSAAVKAASDVCCTSGNAVAVVEALGVPKVALVPDQYLARNVAALTDVEIITHPGACEVHERFAPADIIGMRRDYPGVTVLAHPECPPDVVAEADFSGSTALMSDFVVEQQPERVALITECSMSDNIAAAHPQIDFVRPCNLCPHMKRNTLATIRAALEQEQYAIEFDERVAEGAARAVRRMLELS